jgi:hypothetical protein
MYAFHFEFSNRKALPVHEAHVRVEIDINSFFGLRIPVL